MALLPQDPQKQKKLLIGLLPILAAFAYYQFYHTGRSLEVTELQANVERLETSNAAMRTIVSRYGQDLQQRLAIYQAHVGQLEALDGPPRVGVEQVGDGGGGHVGEDRRMPRGRSPSRCPGRQSTRCPGTVVGILRVGCG